VQVRGILSFALAGTLLAACGGSTSSAPAKMNVSLVDGPSSEYSEVNVDVQTVEILGSSGWVVLGQPNVVVNLLALTGGVSQTLVDGATLPAGHYGQMRLVLGPNNSVKLVGATTTSPLLVPSGQQSGVKLTVSFDVQPGTTADVFIDFDANKSVFVHQAGASGKYILRPTVRAYDKLQTGSISGTLSVDGTGAPLAGVVVTAQTVDPMTGPAVSRTVTTDLNGHYVLDLLPVGGSYFAVSQPVVNDAGGTPTTSYPAKAGGPFLVNATTPTAIWDAAFTAAATTGGITGAITPVAVDPQVDVVQATLPVPVGGGTQTLVVRSTPAVVATTETYAFPLLPVDSAGTTYTVRLQRRSIDALGADTFLWTTPVDVLVTAGSPVTNDITVPAGP
jgi:Domain of unknown function (DUF4382)